MGRKVWSKFLLVDTLLCRFKFRDMGGDGQALLNSRKLLENLYRRQRSDAANVSAVDRQNRLQFCAISHEALTVPVCVDLRSNLYNRAAVVQYLLDRKANVGAVGDAPLVERLRDVRPVVAPSSSGDADADAGAPFELVCAESGKRSSGGRFPFACNWACGHVVCAAEDADLLNKACPLCGPTSAAGDAPAQNIWVRLGLDKAAGDEQRSSLQEVVRPKRSRE